MLSVELNATNHVIKQLSKMKSKSYVSYVVNRIIHLLDDLSLKFITQQFVRRSDQEIALMDLYFPQLDLHVEVEDADYFNRHYSIQNSLDMGQYTQLIDIICSIEEEVKKADIINIVGHRILKINTSPDQLTGIYGLEGIHQQIDLVIKKIRYEKSLLMEKSMFKPWDIHAEYRPETYMALGKICLDDHVVLKSYEDVCQCFGLSALYGEQQYLEYPYERDTVIWFVRLYEYQGVTCQMSADGLRLSEKYKDPTRQIKTDQWKEKKQRRIVFARVQDNLTRQTVYRFFGVFTLDSEHLETAIYWRRVACAVQTYALEPMH